MEIRLSSTDGIPVYRQIVNQVKDMVASGRLKGGQELPTIRALAERLVINPNIPLDMLLLAALVQQGFIFLRLLLRAVQLGGLVELSR